MDCVSKKAEDNLTTPNDPELVEMRYVYINKDIWAIIYINISTYIDNLITPKDLGVSEMRYKYMYEYVYKHVYGLCL
jgi:hypothetical protein